MRAATLGGFLVLPWSSNGGADMEHRLDEGTHRLLKCGALLGVTVFCKNPTFIFCICDITGNRIKINGIRGNAPGGSQDSAQCLSSLSLIQESPSVYLMGWGLCCYVACCLLLGAQHLSPLSSSAGCPLPFYENGSQDLNFIDH